MQDTTNAAQTCLEKAADSTLRIYNISVHGKRTSIRLEPAFWAALKEAAARERTSIHEIGSAIRATKPRETSFTAAIRAFCLLYFRNAATDEGHKNAGHGDFAAMLSRARLSREALHPRKPRELIAAAGCESA